MAQEIRLPEISENVDSGEVIEVLVAEGDRIEVDQGIVELETDKAAFEVPSTVAGTVAEVVVSKGDTVKVGQVLIRVDADAGAKEEPAERQKTPTEEAEPAEAADGNSEEAPAEPRRAPERPEGKEGEGVPPPASPSVRRLARELGADIHQVRGGGPGGRILEEDVKSFTRRAMEQGGTAAGRAAGEHEAAPAAAGALELPDFSRWGEVRREPMSRVRRITARSTGAAWGAIPHVTQFDQAEATAVERFRRRYADAVAAAGGKLTVTSILLKVAASALRAFPQVNASLDMQAEEIIYKGYVHIGVAVDTDRGLLVPVVRDVDRKGVTELAVELGDLAERARNKKIKPDELEGATFTLSNLGGIGGTAFTPIVYHPQAAILGVARARAEVVLEDGTPRERTILPLSLSYDHRLIDGADGARFLRWIVEALEDPLRMMLEGEA